MTTALALRATRRMGRARVVYDCRGDEVAEFLDGHRLDESRSLEWPKAMSARVRFSQEPGPYGRHEFSCGVLRFSGNGVAIDSRTCFAR